MKDTGARRRTGCFAVLPTVLRPVTDSGIAVAVATIHPPLGPVDRCGEIADPPAKDGRGGSA